MEEGTYELGGKTLTFNQVSERILDAVREHFGVENVRRGLEKVFDPLFFSSSELTAIERCLPVVLNGKKYERLAYEYCHGVHAALCYTTSFFEDASRKYLGEAHFPAPEDLIPAGDTTLAHRNAIRGEGVCAVFSEGIQPKNSVQIVKSHMRGESEQVS